jgi:hypothetical protein
MTRKKKNVEWNITLSPAGLELVCFLSRLLKERYTTYAPAQNKHPAGIHWDSHGVFVTIYRSDHMAVELRENLKGDRPILDDIKTHAIHGFCHSNGIDVRDVLDASWEP